MVKKLFSIFLFSVLVFPSVSFAFTQGYTLSGFTASLPNTNQSYCLTSQGGGFGSDIYTGQVNDTLILSSYNFISLWSLRDTVAPLTGATTGNILLAPFVSTGEWVTGIGTVVSVDCDNLGSGGGGGTGLFTSPNPMGEITQVTASTFASVFPYLMLSMGVLVAFLIIQYLIKLLWIDDKKDGYHKIYSKTGRVIGVAKDGKKEKELTNKQVNKKEYDLQHSKGYPGRIRSQ